MAEENSHMTLSIYHQNLRRLKQKVNELPCSLIAKKQHPSSIFVTEPYLTEQKLLLISHKNYHLVSNFSCINNTEVGIYIYTRSEIIKNTSKRYLSIL
jgi:hypothetical protein